MAASILSIIKKSGLIVATTIALFQLTACGDNDADQRKAFANYLQNNVMRSAVPLPTLSEDQKKKLTHYVGDYAILYGFSQQLSRALSEGVQPVIDRLDQIKVAQDYLTQLENLRQAEGALTLVADQVLNAKNLADSSKSSVNLPPDLQKDYDAAYGKTVTQPANQLLSLLPQLQQLAQSVLATGRFLQTQNGQVSFENGQVKFPSQTQVDQYNALIGSISHQSGALTQTRELLKSLK